MGDLAIRPRALRLLAGLLLLGIPAVSELPDRCTIPASVRIQGNHYALLCASVRVEGEITGDLVAIADQIEISGQIGGSVLGVARSVVIDSQIGGSVRALAGSVEIGKGAAIRGPLSDVTVAAFTLISRAALPADVWFFGREVHLENTVSGVRHILLLPEAPAGMWTSAADTFSTGLRDFLVLVVVGTAVLFSAQKRLIDSGSELNSRGFRCLLSGELIFLAILPVLIGVLALGLALVLLLGVFGSALLALAAGLLTISAVIGLACGGLLVFVVLGRIATAYAFGSRLGSGHLTTVPRGTGLFIALLSGVLVVAAFSSLPVLGVVFGQLTACAGIGALARTGHRA